MRLRTSATGDQEGLKFRHQPVFYIVLAGVVLCAGGSLAILWAVVRGRLVAEPLALVVIAVMLVVGQVFLVGILVDMGRAARVLLFAETRLIATGWLGHRKAIPWESIRCVRRLPKRWWARGDGRAEFAEIESSFDTRVRFMSYLMPNYRVFLAELRSRAVACHQFDPALDDLPSWSGTV